MRIAVITNPSAGTAYADDHHSRIKAAFNRNGIEAVLIELDDNKIRKEISSYDVIAAAGGDGTVNSVLNMSLGSELPFGIIPTGTLNHFAKDAGLPLDIEAAADVIIRKYTIPVDVAEVNGHYFVNNSSVGLYPKIIKHRNNEMEVLGYGKWFAMFRAIMNIFSRYPLITFRIRTEEHFTVIKTPFIFVGNNVYSFDLFNLGVREHIDKGVLSLYYPRTRGRFSILRFAFMALINRLHSSEDFFHSECTEIKLNSYRKVLEVSADGEVLHLDSPLKYKIHRGRLNLIVPERR